MVRKFGGERVECHVCKERVYPLEAVKFDSFTYHKSCMRCTHCDGKVGLKGLAMIGERIYCKPHFKELFKQTGGSYDALSQKASTDTCITIESTQSNNTSTKESSTTATKEKAKPPMSPTKSPTKSPKKPMKSPNPSSNKSPGPHNLKKVSPTARDASVEVPLWSPTPKKPCVSPNGEQIIPPSEERQDESEFALTLKEIKTKPHKRPSIVKLDVPKHENQNEYTNTLKSIKNSKDPTKKLKKKDKDGAAKKSGSGSATSKKKKSLPSISESDASDFWLVVEKGNLDSLKEALKDMNNPKVLFIKNDDGQTPVEYAFKQSDSEFTYCGRYMMEYLQQSHT